MAKKTYKKYQKAGNARHYATPYKNLYTRLVRSAKDRKHEVALTYEDYRKIVEANPTCHYCASKLKWVKHGVNAKLINLDRKNNNKGYTKRNVVASCWRCNGARGRRWSYKDWFAMTEVLREKKK